MGQDARNASQVVGDGTSRAPLPLGPGRVVVVAYFARGRALDYARPVVLRDLSVALQAPVTLRALARARRDGGQLAYSPRRRCRR